MPARFGDAEASRPNLAGRVAAPLCVVVVGDGGCVNERTRTVAGWLAGSGQAKALWVLSPHPFFALIIRHIAHQLPAPKEAKNATGQTQANPTTQKHACHPSPTHSYTRLSSTGRTCLTWNACPATSQTPDCPPPSLPLFSPVTSSSTIFSVGRGLLQHAARISQRCCHAKHHQYTTAVRGVPHPLPAPSPPPLPSPPHTQARPKDHPQHVLLGNQEAHVIGRPTVGPLRRHGLRGGCQGQGCAP